MASKVTVDIDDELYARLRQSMSDLDLDRFIVEAVTQKVTALEERRTERERIRQAMREGYLATAADRAELNKDWGVVDIEGWPE
jgi:hypothetical protein